MSPEIMLLLPLAAAAVAAWTMHPRTHSHILRCQRPIFILCPRRAGWNVDNSTGIPYHESAARLAQRQSNSFTRSGSGVRFPQRAPAQNKPPEKGIERGRGPGKPRLPRIGGLFGTEGSESAARPKAERAVRFPQRAPFTVCRSAYRNSRKALPRAPAPSLPAFSCSGYFSLPRPQDRSRPRSSPPRCGRSRNR